MQSITTQPYHGTPTAYVRQVGMMWLGRWWWAVALPIAVLLILSINEAVWLFVAMMLIFLLYPGLTMMVYFNHAFSPEARRTLYEQTVTVGNKKIEVTYTEKNHSIAYTADDISGIEYGAKHVLVKLKHPRYNHIRIPLSAIEGEEQELFFELLTQLTPNMA